MLSMAILFGALSYYGYITITESTNSLLDTLQLQRVGYTVTETDLKGVKVTNGLALAIGTKTGVIIGSAIASIGFFIGNALVMFFGMRKEHLLIKYYEKSKN